jgi:cell division septal protein FtsQ
MRRSKQAQAPVRQPKSDISEQSFAFRRSRTITGSAASTVRAVGEERGQLQSSRLHEHSLRKHRRKLTSYLVASFFIIAGLMYVVSSFMGSSIQIASASTQSLQSQPTNERYSVLVKKYFDSRPFERFTFATDQNAFEEYIRSQVPEIAKARIERGSEVGSASLVLTFREPVVSWTIKNEQYFVDTEGVAFTQNYFAIPTVVVTDKSGISADAGIVASSKLLRFVGRVIAHVDTAAIPPIVSVELPADSTREVDFKLKDLTYVVKAHVDRDPAGQAADIVSAVTYVSEKNITPEYLDVRVSSKAYYRDKQN